MAGLRRRALLQALLQHQHVPGVDGVFSVRVLSSLYASPSLGRASHHLWIWELCTLRCHACRAWRSSTGLP